MDAGTDVESLLAPGRTLRPSRGPVVSALPAGDEGARYDRRAATYDRLIGSRLYNRLAWGTSPSQYTAFAAEAVAAGSGPLLDAGSGTATFTAAAYRETGRPLVLIDRSVDMLERATGRLADAPAAFVQADLLDLPFSPGQFSTVACFGVLHVLDDAPAALAALRDQLAAGGQLFASMLVADRAAGRAYLNALHRAGEVAQPRRAEHLADAAQYVFGARVDIRRTGSMAWLRAGHQP
ncbi:MAG: class I SAM-dependent methyltransferase [Solirubrobacteraceae bacterium]|nr:class I SAM-dependent methyltransferase [Solirubrobacteraceae bacterium]